MQRRSISRSAESGALGGHIDFDANALRVELRRQRLQHFVDQAPRTRTSSPLRIALGGEVQQVVHRGIERGETGRTVCRAVRGSWDPPKVGGEANLNTT